MFDYQIRSELAHEHVTQLQLDWQASESPLGRARYALGGWLIRLGYRVSPDCRRHAARPVLRG
jgi:hypothetical protein